MLAKTNAARLSETVRGVETLTRFALAVLVKQARAAVRERAHEGERRVEFLGHAEQGRTHLFGVKLEKIA